MVHKLPLIILTIVILVFSAITLGFSITQKYDSTQISHTQFDYLLHK